QGPAARKFPFRIGGGSYHFHGNLESRHAVATAVFARKTPFPAELEWRKRRSIFELQELADAPPMFVNAGTLKRMFLITIAIQIIEYLAEDLTAIKLRSIMTPTLASVCDCRRYSAPASSRYAYESALLTDFKQFLANLLVGLRH